MTGPSLIGPVSGNWTTLQTDPGSDRHGLHPSYAQLHRPAPPEKSGWQKLIRRMLYA